MSKLGLCTVLCLCLLLTGCYRAAAQDAADVLQVHMLDVGNADCLLVTQGETAMLIDAGTADTADKVVSYLHMLGIERLDYVLATHPHADHIGGMERVIEAYDVGAYLYAPMPKASDAPPVMLERLDGILKQRAIPRMLTDDGVSFSLGEARVTVFPTLEDYRDENDYSTVCRIDYGEDSVLCMGDAEEAVEEALLASGLDIAADVIKVGHHGGKGACNEAFLKAVGAHTALITCGADNDYDHPHEQTLQTLQTLGMQWYRTDVDGDVVITLDGEETIL